MLDDDHVTQIGSNRDTLPPLSLRSVFIGLDRALDSLFFDKNFDLIAEITSLRQDRGNMVQTHEQAQFLLGTVIRTVATSAPAAREAFVDPAPPALGSGRGPTAAGSSARPGVARRLYTDSAQPQTTASDARPSKPPPFQVHTIGALSDSDGLEWAMRVLAPESHRTMARGLQSTWEVQDADEGRFVVRTQPEDGSYVLYVIHDRRIIPLAVSVGVGDALTRVGDMVLPHYASIEDVVAALSARRLPRDILSNSVWPIRLRSDTKLSSTAIIGLCIRNLSLPENLSEEGLFRVQASTSDLSEFTTAMHLQDAGGAASSMTRVPSLSEHDPHTVATFLKQ